MSFDPDSFDPASVDAEAQLLDLDRADCEESLYEFLRQAWPVFDSAAWKDSWAIEAIAEHLQAVIDGEIRRLLINIPPRCSKSALCSVALPAWTWAQSRASPTSGAGVPFLYASYKDSLSLRDSIKCRRVIDSKWYQLRWGDRFKLTSDQNTVARFSNDKGGERLITSIKASGVVGEGGQIIVIDDGNSPTEVESEATIQQTIDWYDGALSTRFNDPKTGALINVQQRTGERDLSGHILEKNIGNWVHLCLPMKYERDRSFVTFNGWKDPRTAEGELLWPERFGNAEVAEIEGLLGPWRAAGQHQQRPEPRGGGLIKRDWWKLWEGQSWPPMDFVLAWLDTAYTEDQINDPSGMIVWGVYSGDVSAGSTRLIGPDGEPIRHSATYSEFAPRVMCMYAWSERLELHALVKKSAEVCVKMKVDTLVIENKASGISVAQELRRLYSRERFGVQLSDPGRQDKAARLISVQHLFADGVVYGPDRPWMEQVISQVGQFPKGRHDEYVDCTSGALRKLRDMGLLVLQPERDAEIEADRRYQGREQPLYAV